MNEELWGQATSRAGDTCKTERMGLDWLYAGETTQIHSQEGHRVEPTGKVQEI